MKIIYDVGANNGDDIQYYLLKADLVVAIEANPIMIEIIKQRFQAEIASDRLKVEDCAVTAHESTETVPFYLHKTASVQSQFPRPSESQIANFDEIAVKSKSLTSIVSVYGTPHYLKIDVERYDQALLNSLF
jgi:FkbM family methyltransferase